MRIRGLLMTAGLLALFGSLAPAEAAKGDRKAGAIRTSPLLDGRVLDLRFAEFAQGIWASDGATCDALTAIDRGAPGSAIAIFRGLLETPSQICQVYGAQQGASGSQRAAMNCRLDNGGESLGLVTVRPRGSSGLSVQDGEHPPVYYRFCRAIPQVIQSVTQ